MKSSFLYIFVLFIFIHTSCCDNITNANWILKYSSSLCTSYQPAQRYGSAWTYLPYTSTIYFFGGYGCSPVSNTKGVLNDFYKIFTTASPPMPIMDNYGVNRTETLVSGLGSWNTANYPAARYGHTMWSNGSTIVIFGGMGSYGYPSEVLMNDIWVYDTATQYWAKLAYTSPANPTYGNLGQETPGNIPGGRYYTVSWSSGDYAFIFGGYGIDNNTQVGYLSDLWRISIIGTAASVAWIGGSQYKDNNPSGWPRARGGAMSYYAPVGSYIWMFGGNTNDNMIGDLWRGTVANGNVTWYTTTTHVDDGSSANWYNQGVFDIGQPGSRCAGSMFVRNSRVWLFGGIQEYSSTNGTLNDVWEFDTVNQLWRWVKGSGNYDSLGDALNPSARYSFTSIYDSTADKFYVFSGQAATDSTSDIWELSLIDFISSGTSVGVVTTSMSSASVDTSTKATTGSVSSASSSTASSSSSTSLGSTSTGLTTSTSVGSSTTASTSSSTSASSSSSSTTSSLTSASSSSTTSASSATGSTNSASSASSSSFSTSSGSTSTGLTSTSVDFSTTASTSSSTSASSLSSSTTSVGSTTSTSVGSSTTGERLIEASTGGSSSNNGVGIGLGVGFGLLALLIAGMLVFFLLRKKRRHQKTDNGTSGTLELQPQPHAASTPELKSFKQIKNVEIQEKLGGGQFGEVYKGLWQGNTLVALKKLKSEEYVAEFEKEAAMLQSLAHPNVVQYFGIHTDKEGVKYIVTEFLSEGSLVQLFAKKGVTFELVDLLCMAKDAAAGMCYLQQEKIVHRDLALRNLLATTLNTQKYIVKVADFGMSKAVEGNYYKSDTYTIPAKWASPEVIEYGRYSSKSDTWAFGVVLWEIFSFGKIPYTMMSNKEAMEQVVQGYRLPQPNGTPDEIYKLMLRCWDKDPDLRPDFEEICSIITRLYNQAAPKKVEAQVVQVKEEVFYN